MSTSTPGALHLSHIFVSRIKPCSVYEMRITPRNRMQVERWLEMETRVVKLNTVIN